MSGYTITPNLQLKKPIPGSDDDMWGTHWNDNANVIDMMSATAAIGDTAPASQPGLLWFDSTSLQLYVRYNDGNSTQWVPATNVAALSGDMPFLPLSGGNVTGPIVAPQFQTPGSTQTLSGAQTVTRYGDIYGNLAGTSTVASEQYRMVIGAPSDALAAPSAAVSDLALLTNLAAGWQGSRHSLRAYLTTAGNTDLTSSVAAGAGALVSVAGAISSNHNMGGVAGGYGATQFGVGMQWGSVFETIMQGGSTYWNSSIGVEIDNTILSGASAIWNIGLLLNLYPNSQVQGRQIDAAQVISATGAVKWRDGILIGSAQGHAIDPNGYFMRGLIGRDITGPVTAAGGVDMLQPNFSGVGTGGGGFAFRAANFQVLNNGFTQIGRGLLSFDGGGFVIDSPYQAVNGATVAAGGVNFTVNDLLEGTDGSLVAITSVGAGGAVTGVSIVRSGWAKTGSLPSNPVVFTAQGRSGAAVGSGCTLTLTRTAATGISIAPSGGTTTLGGPGNFSAGITFNNNVGAGPTDLSKHVQLYPGYGMSVSGGGRTNIVSATAVYMVSGTTDVASFWSDGLHLVGGFGAFGSSIPATKPIVTGSKGANAALASLLTALASYGLLTDSST